MLARKTMVMRKRLVMLPNAAVHHPQLGMVTMLSSPMAAADNAIRTDIRNAFMTSPKMGQIPARSCVDVNTCDDAHRSRTPRYVRSPLRPPRHRQTPARR